MTRIEANREILKRISEIVERFPDWRFHQILQNMGIENVGADKFYEESVDTLDGIVMLGR